MNGPRLTLLLTGVALLGIAPAHADERPWRVHAAHGPLAYRNHNPLYLQMANLRPARPIALPARTGAIGFTTSYANIFEQFTTATHDVLLDMELLRQSIAVAYGLGHGVTVELELPLAHTEGGFLDGFLQDFHSTFGLPNAGRENFPRDQFVYRVSRGATRLVDAAAAGLHPADLQLLLRHQLAEETRRVPAMGWFVLVELPTGAGGQGLSNRQVDFGFGALAEKSYRRWHGYFNAGCFATPGIAPLNDLMEPVFFSYLLGGEFTLSPRLGLHAQLHGGTPLLKGMGEMRWDDPPLDLAVGLSGDHPKLVWGKDLFWQIGFSEDLHADGPSIDLTIFSQLGLRWGQKAI